MTMIQMNTLFQMGSPAEIVPPLKMLWLDLVNPFDTEGGNLPRMRRVMNLVQHYGVLRMIGSQGMQRMFGTAQL